jgi:hypothetical protein
MALESDAFGSKRVQVWGLDMGVSQHGQAFAPPLIGCYEEYVHDIRLVVEEMRIGRLLNRVMAVSNVT